MGPSSKAWPGTCSRGVVARGEDSTKEVGGCTCRIGWGENSWELVEQWQGR